MKRIRVFRTAEEFIEWINATFPKSVDDVRTDVEYALWAVCLQEAHAVFNSYTTKDVASLFLAGLPSRAAEPMESIQGWLETVNADLLEAVREGDVHIAVDNTISNEEAEMYAVANVVELVTVDYVGSGR